MNSKEKRKALISIIFIVIIILIFTLYNYLYKKVVFANSGEVEYVKISNAEKVDIEKIIQQNTKENTEQIITEEINVEYITQYKNNDELPVGTMQVVQEGRTGKEQVVKKRTIDENGEIVGIF